MKVFKMSNDVDRYQCFLSPFEWGCEPLEESWTPPPLYLSDPDLLAGDFYNSRPNVLVTSPRATSALHEHLERAGQLFPLHYEGETFTLLNIPYCLDVLDEEHSVFFIGETSRLPLHIERYAFHAERFPPVSLFKLPWDFGMEIYAVEGAGGPLPEFREVVTAAGLEGLEFYEIWDSETEGLGPNVPLLFYA